MTTRECLQETWGEPTWSIAHLFPRQGTWPVEEYLALDTNHLVEFLMAIQYQVHQEGRPGMQVSSVLLKGFELSVADIFADSLPD